MPAVCPILRVDVAHHGRDTGDPEGRRDRHADMHGEARGSHRRFTPQLAPERQRELLFMVGLASGAFFRLVLSREWGNGLWGLLVGDYIGTTIGP